jgi:hypothetical protein
MYTVKLHEKFAIVFVVFVLAASFGYSIYEVVVRGLQ